MSSHEWKPEYKNLFRQASFSVSADPVQMAPDDIDVSAYSPEETQLAQIMAAHSKDAMPWQSYLEDARKLIIELPQFARDFVAAGGLLSYADILPGGKGDDKPDSDFDKGQLEKGKKHEQEHTDNPEIANEIAKDHLTEHEDEPYYDLIDLMEKVLERTKSSKRN